MKEYKIISETSNWGFGKVKRAIEDRINFYATQGWKLIDIEFNCSMRYGAFATLEREAPTNEFV